MPDAGGSGGQDRAAGRPAPLLSIVIPAFNAEADLPGCLDSLAGQSFRDFEIIAVDDGSADGTAAILAERAAAEPRLTCLSCPRIGPGAARNKGAAQASGSYLWFVDADDRVAAGCLGLLAERLRSVSPDVLFLDYVLVRPDGTAEPGPDRAALAGDLPAAFTLAEQPWVIDLTMASWNKIIRKDFLQRSGAAFEAQWPHEDIPLTCRLLLEAGRLSVLALACYRYSQARPGSLMNSGESRRHFRAFEVWRAALDEVRKRAESGDAAVTRDVQHAFFQRSVWHCSNLFDTRRRRRESWRSAGLIEAADRRAFFGQLHWHYLHFRPVGYRRPGGVRGVKFRLIERDSYHLYGGLLRLYRLWLALGRGVRPARTGGSRS